LNRQPNHRKRLLVPSELVKPNPKCYVCMEKPEVNVKLNVEKMTVGGFEEKLLKARFGMVAPDAEIDDGKGTILISSEEGETDVNHPKPLSTFISVGVPTCFKCDDFLQNFSLTVWVHHADDLEDGKEFEIVGDLSEDALKPKEEAKNGSATNGTVNGDQEMKDVSENGTEEDDDDLICTDDNPVPSPRGTKRTASTEEEVEAEPVVKKPKKSIEAKPIEDDDGVICL